VAAENIGITTSTMPLQKALTTSPKHRKAADKNVVAYRYVCIGDPVEGRDRDP
jgi:hypothetical protein